MGMMIRRNRAAQEAEKQTAARVDAECGLPFKDVPEKVVKQDAPKTVKKKAGRPKYR